MHPYLLKGRLFLRFELVTVKSQGKNLTIVPRLNMKAKRQI